MATLAEIDSANAFELSGSDLAACGTPDTLESAGAKFLTSVRDALVEAVESGRIARDGGDGNENVSDVIHEIADGAPDVYTATKWAEFIDLAAYQEDPSELGADAADMDNMASVCLYIIAERLCHALLTELAADADDDTEDES